MILQEWVASVVGASPGDDVCDACLAREAAATIEAVRAAADRLGATPEFLRDEWWCSRCGQKRRVTRALSGGLQGAAAVGALQGLHVLVVEDDLDSLNLARTILEEAGARVSSAASAAEGLARVEDDPPDVVLTDIAMPGADGYSFLTQLRKLPPARGGAAPALAVTAFDAHHSRRRVLAAGFQEYLQKPFDPGALCAAVARLARPPG